MEWVQLTGNTLHGSISLCWWCTSRQSLACKGSRIFRFCVMFWKGEREPKSNIAWEDRLKWFNSSPEYRILDRTDGEPMELEWNISQDSPHCSSATKSKRSFQKWAINQKISQDGSSSCRCSMTSHGDLKDNEQECESNAKFVSIFAKKIFTRKMVIPRTWIRKEVVF